MSFLIAFTLTWLQIAVYDILTMHILHRIKDSLHYLGTFLVGEVDSLLLPLLDEIGEWTGTHELHAKEDLPFYFTDLFAIIIHITFDTYMLELDNVFVVDALK